MAALAFGCTMAFARAFGSGFSGALFAGTAAQMDLVSTVSTAARVVVLIALTALGCLHRSAICRLSLGAAGACMGIGVLVLSASALPWLQVVTAIVCGAGSAFAMLSLMMLLSSRSLKEIIAVSLAGLAVGGILIAASSLLPPPVGTVLFAASGVLSTLGILAADPALSSCVDQGAYSADEFRLFPWFSAIMFVVCGILGALIYGVATTLSWNVMEGVSYPVMGVAAALTIVFCVLVVLAVDNWAQVIWVPLFILLAAILAFVITSGQMLGSITLGLVFALILCYHFLRWIDPPGARLDLAAPALSDGRHPARHHEQHLQRRARRAPRGRAAAWHAGAERVWRGHRPHLGRRVRLRHVHGARGAPAERGGAPCPGGGVPTWSRGGGAGRLGGGISWRCGAIARGRRARRRGAR